jgi:uncharacterized protein YlxP (DUF503 family)
MRPLQKARNSRANRMFVGLLTVYIYMSGVHSLKEKRSVVKSLVERLKSRFNVSAAEVDKQDIRTAAVIGVALVSGDSNFLEQCIDTVVNFIHNDGRFYVTDIRREIFSHND